MHMETQFNERVMLIFDSTNLTAKKTKETCSFFSNRPSKRASVRQTEIAVRSLIIIIENKSNNAHSVLRYMTA